MSLDAMEAVMEHSRHPADIKLVLLGCADAADPDGIFSYRHENSDRLARIANVDKPVIPLYIEKLINDGTFERVRGKNMDLLSMRQWMMKSKESKLQERML